jgi:hypothetical protein
MLTATCHCGTVRLTVPYTPRRLTSCNCSICRRYGTLWAYYRRRDVRVSAPRGAIDRYGWAEETLRFVRCKHCGVVTHWEPTWRIDRMGVNARNFAPSAIEGVRVRRLDGALTWKFLD